MTYLQVCQLTTVKFSHDERFHKQNVLTNHFLVGLLGLQGIKQAVYISLWYVLKEYLGLLDLYRRLFAGVPAEKATEYEEIFCLGVITLVPVQIKKIHCQFDTWWVFADEGAKLLQQAFCLVDVACRKAGADQVVILGEQLPDW